MQTGALNTLLAQPRQGCDCPQPYATPGMFPKMEMDEHRKERRQTEARIAELEEKLADYAKKKSGG